MLFMRYVGSDNDYVFLKCNNCRKIVSYDKNAFDVNQPDECNNCHAHFQHIWFCPFIIKKQIKKLNFLLPYIVILSLGLLAIAITQAHFLQNNFWFNKLITSLSPIFTAILIPIICSIIPLIIELIYKKEQPEYQEHPNPQEQLESQGQPDSQNSKEKFNIIALMTFTFVESICLIFIFSTIIQTQYNSIEIPNPNSETMQQYFGNVIGGTASGKGRLFDNQGNLIYCGEFKNNLFDGYGEEFEFVDVLQNRDVAQTYQIVYRGFYKNGIRHGKGEEYRYDADYTFEKNSDIPPYLYYSGEFFNGEYCGYGIRYGIETKYEGMFYDNNFNGFGREWSLDSNNKLYKYEGIYKDGSLTGEGTKYYPDGTLLFTGNYKNGQTTYGTIYNTNGQKTYTGDWNGNKQEGYGTSYRNDGTKRYEGDWINDQFYGFGSLYYEDGITIQYEGNYINSSRNGFGTEYYSNGKKKYEGNWKDHAYSGYGTSYNYNGTKIYEGYWDNNKKNGKGTLYKGNESEYIIYEGYFSNDKREGEGTEYWGDENNTIKYYGYWKNDSYNGWGEEYDENGNLLRQGTYENGICIQEYLPADVNNSEVE